MQGSCARRPPEHDPLSGGYQTLRCPPPPAHAVCLEPAAPQAGLGTKRTEKHEPYRSRSTRIYTVYRWRRGGGGVLHPPPPTFSKGCLLVSGRGNQGGTISKEVILGRRDESAIDASVEFQEVCHLVLKISHTLCWTGASLILMRHFYGFTTEAFIENITLYWKYLQELSYIESNSKYIQTISISR